MTQGINEQVGLVATIESESHFFAVGLQMLGAHPMPTADDTALEKRERGFNGVRVDVAFGVDTELVPDGLVPSVFPKMLSGATVPKRIIGEQNVHVFADVLADVLFERAGLRVFGVKESQIAAALTDADDDFLVVVFCSASLPPIFATNKCFVHFDFAVEHGLIHFHHRVTDAVAEIPRRFVATESKRPLNLTGRHSLLRLAQKFGCQEPLRKWKMRIVEYGSDRHAKLILAIGAFKLALRKKARDCSALAARACHTFRPAKSCKELFAFLFCTVVVIQLSEVHSYAPKA